MKLLKIVTQHTIGRSELGQILPLARCKNRWLIFLYGEKLIKPNTHWELHLDVFAEWFGTHRGTWTFPQESILALAKKSTKKMTNHKAVSFSCVRLFVLERCIEAMLFPFRPIPIRSPSLIYLFIFLKEVKTFKNRNLIEKGEVATLGSISALIDFPEETPVVLHQKVKVNYQELYIGGSCKTPQGYFQLEKIVSFQTQLLGIGPRLLFSKTDPSSHLPAYVATDKCVFDLSEAHGTIFVADGDLLLLNYENK